MAGPFELQYVTVHGHRRAFVKAGSGPALLLVHGLGCNHDTWDPVIEQLAEHYTVIAPDLLGHGASAKPRADYSIGGFANGMRDLLTILGIDRVTVVGHSLGGGVAMQFAYQFPERTERMILVAPGGFGPEVTPIIRAISLPGFTQVMRPLTLPGVRHVAMAGLRGVARAGGWLNDLNEVADIYGSLADPGTRRALAHVTRAVIDINGQIPTMLDRAYLTEAMPTLVIWGTRDSVLPVKHAHKAAAAIDSVHVMLMRGAGHFPHKERPEDFVHILTRFMEQTQPSVYRRSKVRKLLLTGGVKGGSEILDLQGRRVANVVPAQRLTHG